jgi:UDP-N-acetylmuramyl pentapeptide phosphotransferase/UDP-N-acetylglucosamine-1-phosphate transferase
VTIVVHLALGAVAGALWWLLLTPVLAAPAFARTNYRGAPVATAGGLAVVLGTVTVVGAAAVAVSARWLVPGVDDTSRSLVIVPVLGFGLLGLLDDLVATRSGGGFRRHLQALAWGHPSTGTVKLVGGAVIAVITVAGLDGRRLGWLVVDAAVVALAANLGNLLDRAPARTTKVAALAFAILIVATGADAALAGPALVIGAAVALALPELREQVMLGDTGANVIGAAVGLALVIELGDVALAVVAVLLLAANLASEWVSFSSVIDHARPLRWVDRLGSRRRT